MQGPQLADHVIQQMDSLEDQLLSREIVVISVNHGHGKREGTFEVNYIIRSDQEIHDLGADYPPSGGSMGDTQAAVSLLEATQRLERKQEARDARLQLDTELARLAEEEAAAPPLSPTPPPAEDDPGAESSGR